GLPTDRVPLGAYMGLWFRGVVPDMVELRSMAVRCRTQVSERILRRRRVIHHLENVKGCPTSGVGAGKAGVGFWGLCPVELRLRRHLNTLSRMKSDLQVVILVSKWNWKVWVSLVSVFACSLKHVMEVVVEPSFTIALKQ
nr:hypothetical protein [Tanacetum cinerariifolium]